MTEAEKRSLLSFFNTTTNCSVLLIVVVVAFMYYVHTEIDRLDNKMDYAMKQTNDTDLVKMLSSMSKKVTTPPPSNLDGPLDPSPPPSNQQPLASAPLSGTQLDNIPKANIPLDNIPLDNKTN